MHTCGFWPAYDVQSTSFAGQSHFFGILTSFSAKINKKKVLSYAKNIDIRRAISSGNPEELDTILIYFIIMLAPDP